MTSPGEQAKHSGCIVCIARLAEDLAVNNHDGVGAEDECVRLPAEYSESFFACKPFGKNLRRFAIAPNFRNICRLNCEFNTGVAQDFLTPWRCRSQNKSSHRLPTTPRTDSISLAES